MLDRAAEGLRRRFAQPLYVDIMVTRTVNNCMYQPNHVDRAAVSMKAAY
jgi:hypothetical protein